MEGEAEGVFCVISRPWPGHRHALFMAITSVLSIPILNAIPGYYFAGDGARRDKDGYYWITGRVDDVINVSLVTEWALPKLKALWCCMKRSRKPL
jgi:acetyl-CoA synthetase